jgi:hypothetical protein
MKHPIRALLPVIGSILLVIAALGPAQATPSGEHAYYNGRTVFIHTAGTLVGANPSQLNHAAPIYLLTFPVPPGTTGPITLPSGYQPQENGNMQVPYPWHDHLISALPGPGYKPSLRVVVLRYTAETVASPDFQPVTSLSELAAAEQAGEFAVISSGPNPYELVTNDILIRPVVRQ